MHVPREITIESLESFAARCRKPEYQHDPLQVPAEWVEEYQDLWNGTAVLRLPDGSRWLSSRALSPERNDERVIGRSIVEHTALCPHAPAPTPPEMYLNADTLDVHRVFCTECGRLCDLELDWLEAEAALEPWPEEGLDG